MYQSLEPIAAIFAVHICTHFVEMLWERTAVGNVNGAALQRCCCAQLHEEGRRVAREIPHYAALLVLTMYLLDSHANISTKNGNSK